MTHTELLRLLQTAKQARVDRPDVPLALATLVAVEGSSYRQPGALMLCDAEGRVLSGAISGGCLEQDVALRAADVCGDDRGALVSYDLREDLETIWGFGTGCEGIAHILLSTLPDLTVLEQASSAAARRQDGTLLTIVQASDRDRIGRVSFVPALPYLDAGADARTASAANGDGPSHDRASHDGATSVDGGVRDAEELAHRTVQSTGLPFLATRSKDNTVAQVFGSPVRPATQLVIVGASRGAESLAAVAVACGWPVVVVDHRPEALVSLPLPAAVRRVVIAPDQATDAVCLRELPADARTAFALCTHQFEHDRAWIGALIPTAVPYVGVLGSRQRAARLLRAFTEAGAPLRARDRDRLYAPMGLDLGGDSPDDIALATVAEIQAVLQSRPGGSLRARQAPLHTRTDTPLLPTTRAAATCSLPREEVPGAPPPVPGTPPPRRDRDRR